MRPLTLHTSALNDLEYNLYTASLDDLSVASDTDVVHDDGYYERMTVGVREVRAWLRGRYPDLPASDIDAILKLFHPNILSSDSLTGGQFFAALRLVVHAHAGKGMDRTLAFVQAHPETPKGYGVPSHPSSIKTPPSHPDRRRASTSTSPPHESNPFTHRSIQQALPPIPSPSTDSDTTVAIPRRPSQKTNHNPFLTRDRADESGDSATKCADKNTTKNGRTPPLPPRKPAQLSTPARRASEASPFSKSAGNPSSTTTLASVPHVPAKPGHVMSPLMRQSLEASKHGQTMKRAEEQLDRERILQILKTTSSSSSSGSIRTRSSSPSKDVRMVYSGSESEERGPPVPPLLPRRRRPSPPSSTSSSLPSLDQVASATLFPPTFPPPLPSRTVSITPPDTDDASSQSMTSGPMRAPPTHPDRRFSNDTNDSQSSSPSFPGVSRSKTVHSSPGIITHTGPPLPPPPPRRKRPESVQLTPHASTTELASAAAAKHPPSFSHSRTSSFQGLSRHLSLTRDNNNRETTTTTTDASAASPMSNIQKTLTNLQLRAQPKLEAARYKAEAGLSKRGYVHHPHHLHHAQFGGTRWREESKEGLMSDTRWTAHAYDEPTTDDEPNSGNDDDEERGDRLKRDDVLREADNLKWPAGEGWKPL